MNDIIIPFHINTSCPLMCPYCYLDGMLGRALNERDIDLLLSLGPEEYVCIGKEPTQTHNVLAYFLRQTQERDYGAGFITNGVLLSRFLTQYPDVRTRTIDITYHEADDDRWKLELVREGAVRARTRAEYLSVLFVLHKDTRKYLERAIRFAEDIGADNCVVSPMIPSLRAVPFDLHLMFPTLVEFFGMLKESQSFLRSNITVTAIDDYHFLEAGTRPLSPEEVMTCADSEGLHDKVVALGDPFLRERPVMDVDMMADIPVALHPVARLNTDRSIRAQYPTVPCEKRSARELYIDLREQMMDFDHLHVLTTT